MVNVFDFDGTIYKKQSAVEFLKYCLKKQPILRLKVVMGSRIDKYTGVLTGKLCLKEEKIQRFRRLFPDDTIQKFYTDEVINDAPLIAIAETAYVVDGK